VLHQNRDRAEAFGTVADQYDRARPDYPEALVDSLLEDRVRSASPSPQVLDVGCGTGIAARQFVARGCLVLGVEPDERMAAVARRHGLAVDTGRFEEWDATDRRFDLLVSGQAWHWVDPVRGALKAGMVLRPGGRVGLFWNVGHLPPDVDRALSEPYQRVVPELHERSVMFGRTGRDRLDAAASGLRQVGVFTDPEVRKFSTSRRMTRDQWLDLVPTHSDHRLLPEDQLARLLEGIGSALDRLGGSFMMTYDTWLVTATTR
jgi:SAM-dependent methyltransferase